MRSTLLSLVVALVTLTVACGGGDTKKDEQPVEQTEQEYTEAMGEEHKDDSPDASPQAEEAPSVAVTTKKIVYHTEGDREINGLHSMPESSEGRLPGIIVIHEWWGLNANIKSMSEQLAAQGYQTLAVDLYKGRTADNPDKAKELMTEAMASPDEAKANLRSAYATLKKNGAAKIAVLGWCFGGAWSLQTALLFPDKLAATVIYYGRLEQDKEKLATLKMPILGIFGGKDAGIPVAGVRKFEKTLKDLGKDADIRIYADANHAFANPSGQAYDEKAAKDAWKRTTAFLAEHLKGEAPAADGEASAETK